MGASKVQVFIDEILKFDTVKIESFEPAYAPFFVFVLSELDGGFPPGDLMFNLMFDLVVTKRVSPRPLAWRQGSKFFLNQFFFRVKIFRLMRTIFKSFIQINN